MTHPILVATSVIDEALKTVADTNPAFMATADKASALRELVTLESRMAELRMRILASADDLAAESGARDAAGWLADSTHTRFEDARADLRLAVAFDRRWQAMGAALREGRVNTAQASVIVRALDELPDEVPTAVLHRAEAVLIEHAGRFAPKQLARIGRHILTVVAPDLVDEAEGRRLAALEAEGRRRTRLTLRRMGDGTTRVSGLIPDASATRLATCLEAYANPRRDTADADPTIDPVPRLPYPRRLGEAFCQLIEALDPQRLPVHGGNATTVVVTIPFDSLVADLGTGDLWAPGMCRAIRTPTIAPESRSPRRRRDAWPATPASSPRCSAEPPRSSTWAAPNDSSPLPSASPADPRPHLSGRGMRHPRDLVRSPPLGRLAGGRRHRPRQRRAPLLAPPPSSA